MAEKWDRLMLAIDERTKEWDKNADTGVLYRAVELAGEVGEAAQAAFETFVQAFMMSVSAGRMLNVVKKLEREHMGMSGSRATKEDLANEIADTIICALRLARKAGIDPWWAVVRKFNEVSLKLGLNTLVAHQASHSPESERYALALRTIIQECHHHHHYGDIVKIAETALNPTLSNPCAEIKAATPHRIGDKCFECGEMWYGTCKHAQDASLCPMRANN